MREDQLKACLSNLSAAVGVPLSHPSVQTIRQKHSVAKLLSWLDRRVASGSLGVVPMHTVERYEALPDEARSVSQRRMEDREASLDSVRASLRTAHARSTRACTQLTQILQTMDTGRGEEGRSSDRAVSQERQRQAGRETEHLCEASITALEQLAAASPPPTGSSSPPRPPRVPGARRGPAQRSIPKSLRQGLADLHEGSLVLLSPDVDRYLEAETRWTRQIRRTVHRVSTQGQEGADGRETERERERAQDEAEARRISKATGLAQARLVGTQAAVASTRSRVSALKSLLREREEGERGYRERPGRHRALQGGREREELKREYAALKDELSSELAVAKELAVETGAGAPTALTLQASVDVRTQRARARLGVLRQCLQAAQESRSRAFCLVGTVNSEARHVSDLSMCLDRLAEAAHTHTQRCMLRLEAQRIAADVIDDRANRGGERDHANRAEGEAPLTHDTDKGEGDQERETPAGDASTLQSTSIAAASAALAKAVLSADPGVLSGLPPVTHEVTRLQSRLSGLQTELAGID
ncbi:hypothetical protein KIPB_003706 [Kipferlia bialata]|uniref:Uncharacterized protein n=1 Tax=Kipferlia bialata TaxID=797122 RepID=A0A9K3CSU1_9EUKA|nr:hypothetical protein KIPB_003706 [Kipferlia bialata]|eukprot:g3706.t1